MIYPPDEQYTPPPSPEREVRRSRFKPSQFDETFQQRISREPIDAHSESQYRNRLFLRHTDSIQLIFFLFLFQDIKADLTLICCNYETLIFPLVFDNT